MLSPTIAPSAAQTDHERQGEVAGARDHAGGDDGGLARDEREERVDRRDGEDERVRPPGAGHPLDELVEEAHCGLAS